MADKKPRAQRLLDVRGRPLIIRHGVRRASLAADGYHLLRTTTWPRVLGLFAALFIVSNLVFGVLFALTGGVTGATGFLDDLWFSVQTLATIGYGALAPATHAANSLVAIESFYSIILIALITGVFFARFSTPSTRVVFSKVALITDHDGQRVFLFRMANERTTPIVEATVRVYLTREETLANGEHMRRVYDLHLKRSTSPVFALSFLCVHVIDEHSPLWKKTVRDLRETEMNVVVTFTGIDDQLASTVHTRYVWNWPDIEFDKKFVDLFGRDAHGRRVLDLRPMHETTDLQESP